GWAHAGLISLDTPFMPEQYRNSVIFGSIHGCSVKQNILKPNGSSYIASRGDDFLVSGAKNFRPINLRWVHNGEIYCIDWHDQNPCHQAAPDSWDYEHGRVYRIQTKGLKTKVAEDLSNLDRSGLAQLLNDPNPYRARTGLRLLHEKHPGFLWMGGLQHSVYAEALIAPVQPVNESAEFWGKSVRLDDQASHGVRFSADNRTEKNADSLLKCFRALAQRSPPPNVGRELASASIALRSTIDVGPLVRDLLQMKGYYSDPIIPQLLWVAYEPGLAAKPKDELTWLKDNAPANELIAYIIIPRALRRLVATDKAEDLAACIAFLGEVQVGQVNALEALVSAIGNRTVDAPKDWKLVEKKLAANENADVRRLTNSLAV